MSETQDLVESTGTRSVIAGPVGQSTLVSNKKWIVIQVSWLHTVKKITYCTYAEEHGSYMQKVEVHFELQLVIIHQVLQL